MRALLRVLAVLGAAALCGTANATEQILSFDVQIHVLEGGTLEVTETIAVSVEGKQIKRGIFRDFPVAYNEDGGRVALASLEVLEVLRNGAAENYHRSSEGAYARIRKQFKTPIGYFEGVEEPLARMAGYTYMMDAARKMTAGAIDQGEHPSVVSAIAKYSMTERMRQVVR